MKEFSSIFYENTILNDGTVLEGANLDAIKGVRIYKKKLNEVKKRCKSHIKSGDNKAAIKDLDEMEKLLKKFDSEMRIIKDDQTITEIYIGTLIYFVRALPSFLISLPVGILTAHGMGEIAEMQRTTDKDIKNAGGPDKYHATAEDMNPFIRNLRSSLYKYEDYIKKVKRKLAKKSTNECGLMDFDLI